ncbi:retrovirus-related pol polyprotein from transposon TNT 1-94 [Tanacetum coccineum]
MTMPRMQLNSKFVNNMLPEWSRFITEVKLNRGLKESNFDQLYAYLKQHEVHANENRTMMERFLQPTNDPLALTAELWLRCREIYNANNQGRPFQRNNARGNVVAGNVGGQNRGGIINPGFQTHFQRQVLLMQAQGDGAVMEKKSRCFLRGENRIIMDEYHEVHEMQSDVQHNYVVDSNADYTSDSNIIPYDQYVEDNEEHVVQSNVSSVQNDTLRSILDEMHEQGVQKQIFVQNDNDMKKAETSVPKPLSALTVYPPNTPVKLVPRVLPTKSQVKINLYIKKLGTSDSEKDNVIRDLKVLVANVNDRSYDGTNAKDVTALIEQNKCVRVELEKTNVPMIHSTRVNSSTEASGSTPRSNTKKNRILPAKTENKKKVEDHPRTNKSVWTKVNRVDSSISSKRVAINSNSESVCKTCNKCLNSANHEMCVVNILNSMNAVPTVKIVLNKGKQIWKPKGKLSDNSLNKTKQVWKATGKLFANVGYQWRSTGKKVALGKLNCGYQWRPTGKKFALGELCPLTRLSVQCSIITANHQVILWYLDSGCSKHMTGNRSKLKNFVEKFIGTVRFGNDHFGAIMGYGDYVIGDSVISRVYYVEGLGHNLFSVGQFCDFDLEVAFRKHSCFVRDINGADLLKGSRSTNLYTISIDDIMKSFPICLLSKASKSKSWLWHHRLNHLNFDTINDLAQKDLVRGLPRLKFEKDHLCSACQLGKSKKFSHKPKFENTNMEVLHTLHMYKSVWFQMRVPRVGLNKTVRYIRTDNGTEFVNQVMSKYYEGVGIFHQKSVPRTPQQNGVVERRNRTLVEAARTMLIFSKAPMFLWAEAVATACYTQNRSLIHTRHNKTPYELVHDKKPDLTFLRVFGALCYPTNDSEDLGKFQAKADIGIFVGTRAYHDDPWTTQFRAHSNRQRAEFNAQVVPPGTSLSTTIAQDAPSTSASSSTSDMHHPVRHQGIAEEPTLEDSPINHDALHPSFNPVTREPGST